MKTIIKQLLTKTLHRYGFEKKGNERNYANYIAIYNIARQAFAPQNEKIVSIVFSKDRAMQLDAFLGSYLAQVKNYGKMYVLYFPSDERHAQSYEELKHAYRDFPVVFIRERNFKEDLLRILTEAEEDRVFFYVDDMIFTQVVDYSWFSTVDPLQYTVTLSRGSDLIYSTVLAREIPVPKLSAINEHIYQFSWQEVSEYSDWTFPLGVSGYMYARREMAAILSICPFRAPNSLETCLQDFVPSFITRNGICLYTVATPCIHTNLTQTEGYNHVLGFFSIDELLDLWNEGKRIDFKAFFGVPAHEAELKKYTFIAHK